MSSLSSKEVEGLLKWIEYHLKGYENEQSPQLLASYIKSLITRQASQQRMVAVLRDFMDDKAEDFVSLLEKHLKTKDFSIPEDQEKENIKITTPKKQESVIKIKIEEVRPENLVARPVNTEKESSSQKIKKESKMRENSKTEKDIEKSREKNSSTSSIFGKKESSQKTSSTISKEKDRRASYYDDDKNKDKNRHKDKEKNSLKSKDRNKRKSYNKRSSSHYSSSYDSNDYTNYDYEDDYDDYEDDYNNEYDYNESDYYSYDTYEYVDERPKKRPVPYSNFDKKKRKNQIPTYTKTYKSSNKSISSEFERKSPYFKKPRYQKNTKDYTSYQKNTKNDNETSNPTYKRETQNEDTQIQNKSSHEPSEVDREHIFIIAICGIPPQFNTIGHILKEFNRFGLIHGIQIVPEQKMALIEFGELEAAYRAVNSRHRFFHNSTIKIDYAVQIDQKLLDPIAEKIKQRKLIVENKKKERLLKKQRDIEARSNALAQAAAMAAAAINNRNDDNDQDLPGNTGIESDKELEENAELLLKALTEKIDEYEKLEDSERKEKLRNEIEELSSFLDYIS